MAKPTDARHRPPTSSKGTEPPQLRAGNDFQKRFQKTYGLDLLMPCLSDDEVTVVKGRAAGREGKDGKGRDRGIGKLPPRLKDSQGQDRFGRVDFVLWTQPTEIDSERSIILIELKSTDWDTVKNVRRLALRHAAQVFGYMCHCWELVKEGAIDSFQAAVVYPKRPVRVDIADRIVKLLGEDGIGVYWYDEFAPGEVSGEPSDDGGYESYR